MITPVADTKLDEFVAKIESDFPQTMYREGGSRARAAADIVRMGGVVKAGDVDKVDYYSVGDYTTSVKGGGCTCSDVLQVHGKKFCKHRIAAMMLVRLTGGTAEQRLRELLTGGGEEVVLRVYVLHTAGASKYKIEGHRYSDGAWHRYQPDQYFSITPAEFEKVLADCGWVMSQRPAKQPSMYYHYFLSRSSVARGEMEYHLSSTDAAQQMRTRQNERLSTMFERNLEHVS